MDENAGITILKKGLICINSGKFLSRWKERYCVLTLDYLYCFKKESKIEGSDMGGFCSSLNLADIDYIDKKERKKEIALEVYLLSTGKLYLRCKNDQDEWLDQLRSAVADCKGRKSIREEYHRISREFKSQLSDSGGRLPLKKTDQHVATPYLVKKDQRLSAPCNADVFSADPIDLDDQSNPRSPANSFSNQKPLLRSKSDKPHSSTRNNQCKSECLNSLPNENHSRGSSSSTLPDCSLPSPVIEEEEGYNELYLKDSASSFPFIDSVNCENEEPSMLSQIIEAALGPGSISEETDSIIFTSSCHLYPVDDSVVYANIDEHHFVPKDSPINESESCDQVFTCEKNVLYAELDFAKNKQSSLSDLIYHQSSV